MKSLAYSLLSLCLLLGGCQGTDSKTNTAKSTEISLKETPNHDTHLVALKWLLGSWEDKDDDSKIERVGSWDKQHSFIVEEFRVYDQDNLDIEGRQIIAWDAALKQIRSWIFDSDGGFGEGVWKQTDKGWNVYTTYTLADGKKASAVFVYTNISPEGYTWQATGRTVDGELLPNIDPVNVKHKADK